MDFDTKSMREILNATPGDRVAMGKEDLHAMIDAVPGDHLAIEKSQIRHFLDGVDLGRIAEQLVGMGEQVRALAIAA